MASQIDTFNPQILRKSPTSLLPAQNVSYGLEVSEFQNLLTAFGESSLLPKCVAVSGSSGLIGSRVVALLSVLGHRVIRLRRGLADSPVSTDSLVHWAPDSGLAYPNELNNIDAVIHLAGEGIGDRRWSDETKARLRSSRIHATHVLASQLSRLPNPPKAFVSASGVGIYGDHGEIEVDETQSAAQDFLGSMAQEWEQASQPLADVGTRVCFGRLGIALTTKGGALAKILPLFRLGLGGRLGSGKQYWSWISLDDAARAFVWLALNPNCDGAYNLVAGSVTNAEFTSELAKALSRPAFFAVPAFALRWMLGEMADGLLLNSTRASGKKLCDSGFPILDQELGSTLRTLLGVHD